MEDKNNNGGEETSIDGDILDSIFFYLPLLDLDSACQVSKSWNRAAFFSLRRLKTMPWLFVYSQRTSPPYNMATTAMTYDPKSDQWIHLKTASPPVEHLSTARSSHSTLLYTLSPTRFSFSVDAFHLSWRHVAPPRVWRIDPIVAVVGRSLIVAGGVSDFEEDRFAVELFNIESGGAWERCESMPDFLYESASSTWLSVAASSKKMYVTEKRSGLTCSFDPVTKSWTKLHDLCPGDCRLYTRSIGFASNRLIMAGIIGDEEGNPTGIELWEVVSDESPMILKFDLIGSMPKACLDKLRVIDSDWPLTSITLNAVGDMVYIHNTAETGDIVVAEIEEGKLCKWKTLPNANAIWNNKSNAVERLIVACSNVGFSDLKRASRNNLSFFSTKKIHSLKSISLLAFF